MAKKKKADAAQQPRKQSENKRAAKTPGGDVYEYWYESEIAFPEGYDAKCADEKERGPCNALGLASDRSFQKNEILKSEGTLHFSGTEKGGWTGEDGQTY